jgi:hypothetical protein
MRARDTKKTLRDLVRMCRDRGIQLTVEPRKGSHRALIFFDPETGEEISVTIAWHKEISPGVQRGISSYITESVERVAVADIVKEILDKLFGG